MQESNGNSSGATTSQIVCDILDSKNKSLSIKKALMFMWDNKANDDIVNEIVETICKFADEKNVFTDLEFYLPQLAHWIVHLGLEKSNKDTLRRFTMILSQNSMHTALQLIFMVRAYLEDYQPETRQGKKNPNCNPFLFHRCARLLQDIERAVIYGGSDVNAKEELLLMRRDPSSNDLANLKKNELADAIATKPLGHEFEGTSNGFLFYKRTERKSIFHTKPWKKRFFVIDQRIASCYRDPYDINPVRAIHLQYCEVVISPTSPKYGDTCFEIISEADSTKYLLRAESEQNRERWIKIFKREINGVPPAVLHESNNPSPQSLHSRPVSVNINNSSRINSPALDRQLSVPIDEAELTSNQRIRYHHFRQEQVFITNLTNICERLRFKDRPLRKYFLRRDLEVLAIPPFTYIPLYSSTDVIHVVRNCIFQEGYAFNTKERCPCLMLFETECHPNEMDIATFLDVEVEKYEEKDIVSRSIEVVHKSASSVAELSNNDNEDSSIREDGQIEKKSTCFTLSATGRRTSDIWKEDGTGFARLNQSPPALISLTTKIASVTTTHIKDIQVNVPSDEMRVIENPFIGESFEKKTARIQEKSDYGHLSGWKLDGFIAKSNDDLRQEVFVMQLISLFKDFFTADDVPVWLYTYKIMNTSKSTGLIELIKNATSLDGLKKSKDYPGSLRLYYEKVYGKDTPAFKKALSNYIASMAGYSIVCYLLGIKDRHNGNVMIDLEGHIIHIDFGFVFGLAPGKAFSMEKAPWKLTKEMAEVMGGNTSAEFAEYTRICKLAFLTARKHAKEIIVLIEIMTYKSNFPSFRYNPNALRDFQNKLFLNKSDQEINKIVDGFINESYNYFGTDLYDQFQLATNGIAI